MKLIRFAAIGIVMAVSVIPRMPAYAEDKGDNFYQGIINTFKEDKLTDNKIIQGLKEALEIGTANAVKEVSKLEWTLRKPPDQDPPSSSG
jgi:hypothetical protein